VGVSPAALPELYTRCFTPHSTARSAMVILRPATFMELLVMPGFGLDEGHFHFFMLPEGRMQVLRICRSISALVS
jgi:hypothetical protein